MLTQVLKSLFRRDLERLRLEIELYKDESKLWYIEKGIANSAGNLCLHLIGNLNTYIGAELGKTGYVRHRELEFSLKDIPKAELLRMIDETIDVVNKALDMVTDEQLEAEYPTLVFEEPTTTGYFLVHLTTHLTYHRGQINYHRRLLDV
ncbi:DinB family protein [Spirosoma foliorum]|uniref:DinB family protein n=1 Tax=Spirosoma foliorum TaxID=2710596 RepID=A0A7G5GTR1_9BACT|nr:DinB family protein [Spirosoma foliorum]QMW02253.1 DinB family protein [Spirosoma foliorum]